MKNQETVLYEIVFADGFNFDEITFAINEKEIIKSVLKSDDSDGITSLGYKIIKNGDKLKLINSNQNQKSHKIDNKIKLELSVFHKGKWHYFIPRENMGKYILIELSDSISFNQQKLRPLFD